MASTYERLLGLSLSAVEVRELTGWPESMVNDYISLIEGLIELANLLDFGNSFAANVQKQIITLPILPEKFTPKAVVTNANYTSIGEEIIICNNVADITITLNANPDNFEEINIKRTSGVVNINGNGKLIDGKTDLKLILQYINLHLVYSVETDSWFII